MRRRLLKIWVKRLSNTASLQSKVVAALLQVVPKHALLWHDEDTTPFECDGLTAYRQRPMVVALPETYEQVQAILKPATPWVYLSWRVVREQA